VDLGLGAVGFGLASALSWGAGDFSGGLAAKRSPVLAVVAFGQATGFALVVALALMRGEPPPAASALAWAAGAGASGAVGLAALYRGLAVGRMGLVAPVSAVLCAGIPVLWGAHAEGLPGPAKLAGFGLALVGIWLLAGLAGADLGRRGLGLALLAGCGFGGFLVLMARGAHGGTYWPLAAARGSSLLLALAAALASRQPWRPALQALPLVLLSGALDAGGNAFFVRASQTGRLDVAAILSSMYPATTVLLAALLLRERASRPQVAGIAVVLAAIGLIAW
jgi:drug/metabolite transporter (DMT)-like permease